MGTNVLPVSGAFEDNAFTTTQLGLSGSWAGPQHYGHFFPGSHHRPTESVYEPLATLQTGRRTGQGCSRASAPPLLSQAFCRRLNSLRLYTCLSSPFSCNLLYREEEVHMPAFVYEKRRATSMSLIRKTSQIINMNHSVCLKGVNESQMSFLLPFFFFL